MLFAENIRKIKGIYPAENNHEPERVIDCAMAEHEFALSDGKHMSENDTYIKSLSIMISGDAQCGLYLAVKGGHNAESHNHNDVGNFVVYKNKTPFLIDAGCIAYSAKTFSEERYSIWCNSSKYHNLPLINGYEQIAGAEHCAENIGYSVSEHKAEFSMDICRAYPEECGVKSWYRSFVFNKKEQNITITETTDKTGMYELRFMGMHLTGLNKKRIINA